jgi:hypothetical protein
MFRKLLKRDQFMTSFITDAIVDSMANFLFVEASALRENKSPPSQELDGG